MKATVQARLDAESARALSQLSRRLGWSPSRVVREALCLVAAYQGREHRTRIIGAGKFSSGIPDLGSNKEHLRGLGR